jgi:hypothetical protein
MDEEINKDELNALYGDHENNNSSSSGESGDGSVDSESDIPRTNLETQNKNYEPLDQYRGQQRNPTDSDPMREMRYRDINEVTMHQNIGSYAYEAQSEYNTSSSQEISSTYNPYVGHEDSNNLPFGSVEQYPQYFTMEDDELIQPARHSFWQ